MVMLRNLKRLLPELVPSEVNSMKASGAFLKGLLRRLLIQETQKIFVIGFHKTGTSSLGKALQILGYRVCGSMKEAMDYDQYENKQAYILDQGIKLTNRFDAFQDTPWFWFYKELYAMYPQARFILTKRESDAWHASYCKHFGERSIPFHALIYGSTANPIDHADTYKLVYEKHNLDVINFFSEKENFLVMDVERNFNWDSLCTFLNVSRPLFTFPSANTYSSRRGLVYQLKKKIKKLYYQ